MNGITARIAVVAPVLLLFTGCALVRGGLGLLGINSSEELESAAKGALDTFGLALPGWAQALLAGAPALIGKVSSGLWEKEGRLEHESELPADLA